MSSDFYQNSIFGSNNARHKTPEEIAQSFVPPADFFDELSSKNNHVIIGPRGTGKTTLLKMLTLPALVNWPAKNNTTVLSQSSFIGVFIPADNGWHVQINDNQRISIGVSAFTTHVLMAFVQALLDIRNVHDDQRDVIENLPKKLTPEEEANLVGQISQSWKLKPTINSFEGLKLSLRQRLSELHDHKKYSSLAENPEEYLMQNAPYVSLGFKESISFAIDAYELLTGSSGSSWGLLFDEFEIAPKEIQNAVLECLRGEQDGRLIFKIALAPYNENFIENFENLKSVPSQDYKVLNLWYSDKRSSLEFSENLLKKIIKNEGIDVDGLSSVLGKSKFNEAENPDAYGPDGEITKIFHELSNFDRSFREFCEERHIFEKLKAWNNLPGNEKAGIRKIRSVAISRKFFLKENAGDDSSKATQKRSAKDKHKVYTGFPTMLEICEGNPRTIINMFSPLVRELKILRAANSKKQIPDKSQSDAINYAVSSFRGLLKTIEYQHEDGSFKSLLHLLDQIGEYFAEKCLGENFHPEPNLSFIVHSNAPQTLIKSLGVALNAGAILYVPNKKADPVMGSVKGKRFRLNYLLAASYGLPIMLNSSVSLEVILSGKINSENKVTSWENMDLFAESDSHDE